MKSSKLHALLAAAALIAGVGCDSSNPNPVPPGATGSISVHALTARGDIAAVSLAFTQVGGTWSKTFDLQNSKADRTGTWSLLAQQLPVGSYAYDAKALDGAGSVLFEASSDAAHPVVVVANSITNLTVSLQETKPHDPFKNGAPSFVSLVANRTNIDASGTVKLRAVATDPDGEALVFSWSSSAGGTFGQEADTATTSDVTFTPPGNGTYVITVKATDPLGSSAALSLTINVSGANATGSILAIIDLNSFPAVTQLTTANGQVQVNVPVALTASASDADGDALTFSWSADCGHTFSGQTDASGQSRVSFTFTGTETWGFCTVTVTASDGRGGSNSGSLKLALTPARSGSGPEFYVSALTPVYLEVGQKAEVSVVPSADSSGQIPQTWSWAYAWSDGLQGSFQGSFAPNAADGSDQLYTPASCDALGQGDHLIQLSVVATDSTTQASNGSSIQVTVHCASAAWKFGVMSDTQWGSSPDGKNPNSVAVDVINHLNDQFIQAGVKFVVAVGDVTDNGSTLALDTRATFAQALYDAGVGFYPLRGNHESSAAAAAEFRRVFPQTQTGLNNQTPANAFVATPYYGAIAPRSAATFTVGNAFASFSFASNGYDGLFYGFDYGNARFVLVDQFAPVAGATSHSVLDSAQVDWVGAQLAGKPAGGHAFVFSHKGLITEDHADTLFGNDPSANPALQNVFMANLAKNGVRYLIGGHDHMHNRARVVSPDGASQVQDIILASDSYKFYTPANPSNDSKYDTTGLRETELAQELYTTGYYIVTVDGARVTVDYFASPNGESDGTDLTNDLIPYTFSKHERFGYGLNGKEYLVAQGGSYTVVNETFQGTTAQVLSGANGATDADPAGRHFTKAVDTAWEQPALETASSVFTLWGMASVRSSNPAAAVQPADAYALSLSYDPGKVSAAQLASGHFGLAVRTSSGAWINAAGQSAASPTFVNGPWQSSYAVGTYGIDSATQTVWAVIDFTGDFAAGQF
jgi:hypothetical protein